eukprot:CAMPEP_0170183258 /NCGR_PEP_ID=MMETSP0040_2-20121228/30117_1 /TAXON_ID=641309 /ORGANISM="Lotharella oceanica, Strain CCMP622" /LENGTH=490 /DNA_ID=CAMNT_0010428935 /DNA_START=84 /DNA_END=1556 /DNA_ORIENTATION=-
MPLNKISNPARTINPQRQLRTRLSPQIRESACKRNARQNVVGYAAKKAGIVKKAQPYADEIRSNLVQWLQEEGMPDQNVEIRYVGPAGWGLVAKKPLKRGDQAIKIPENLLITSGKVLVESKFAGIMKEKKLPEYWMLAMFLVENYAMTQEDPENCRYAPYIKSLPDETGNVLEWTSREIADLLKGSPMERMAYQMVSDVKEAIQFILKAVKGHPNAYYMSEARLRWAFSLLFSRVVRLTSRDRQLALIPWADMLNHKPDVESFIDWEEKENSVVFRTDREYRQGEEVFVSYGPRSSGDLLLTYGFVPSTASNPETEKVDLRFVLDGYDPYAGPKKQALKKYGLDSSWTFPLQLNRFPIGLVEYASFLAFRPKSESEVDFYAKQLFGPATQRVIPAEIDTIGRDLIQQECFNALSRYRGSVETDRLMLEEMEVIAQESIMSQDKRAAAAAAVRLRERAILRKTRDAIFRKGSGNFIQKLLRRIPVADLFN